MAVSLQVAQHVPTRRPRRRVAIAPRELADIKARFDSLPTASRWCGYATHHQPHLDSLTLFVRGCEHVHLGLVRYDDGAFDLMDEDGQAVTRGHDIGEILDLIERL